MTKEYECNDCGDKFTVLEKDKWLYEIFNDYSRCLQCRFARYRNNSLKESL